MAKKSGKTSPTKATKVAKNAIPSSWKILWNSWKLILEHRRPLLGIVGIYGLLSLIFQGEGLFSVNNLSRAGGSTAGQTVSQSIATALAAVSGSGSDATSGAAGVMQFVLMVIVSLIIIWALRQIYSKKSFRVKDAYYRGPATFVPFLLVLLVLAIQMVPLILGTSLYQAMIVSNIAVTGLEQGISAVVAVLMAIPTFYWLASSLFALYIVTLPGMTPIAALRSASQMVKGRRLLVFRKLVLLPFVLGLVTTFMLVPIILLVPKLSAPLFFVTTTVTFLMMHTYMYALYRELLDE